MSGFEHEFQPSTHVDRGETRGFVAFGGQRAICFIKKAAAGETVNGERYPLFDYDFIMELHNRVSMSPGVKGFLRETDSVTVGGVPVRGRYWELPFKLRAFGYWLCDRMEELKQTPNLIKALEIAAAAHYGLTNHNFHPFDNGNGRTARALVNAILMSQTYELTAYRLAVPPVPILRPPSHGSDAYIQALREVDKTKTLNPFMIFLAKKWAGNLQERLKKIEGRVGKPQRSGDIKLIKTIRERLAILEKFANNREPKYTNRRSKTVKVENHQIFPIPDYFELKHIKP